MMSGGFHHHHPIDGFPLPPSIARDYCPKVAQTCGQVAEGSPPPTATCPPLSFHPALPVPCPTAINGRVFIWRPRCNGITLAARAAGKTGGKNQILTAQSGDKA